MSLDLKGVAPSPFDKEMAIEALVEGYDACPRARRLMKLPEAESRDCICPQGQIAACETVNNRIALAIAAARKM